MSLGLLGVAQLFVAVLKPLEKTLSSFEKSSRIMADWLKII